MNTALVTPIDDSHTRVPQVKGWPFIGCLPNFIKDPLVFFRDLALKHEDIVEFRFGSTDIALVTSAALTHTILVKEVKNFRKANREITILGAFLGNGLLTNNDTRDHKKHRKLAQPGFHFRRIQGYAETMIDYCDRYVSEWQDNETRDINDDMFKLSMYIVSKTLFNIDMEAMVNGADSIGRSVAEVQVIANGRFNQLVQYPKWLPIPSNLREKRVNQSLRNTIRDMIDARTKVGHNTVEADDLMAMLMHAQYEDGSKMSDEQVMDELITLFIAGHETTSNALTWALYLLSQNPAVQEKLHSELDHVIKGETPEFSDLEQLQYTEMVVKEAMRLYPPAWTLSARQANEDCVIDGYLIPKDKTLFISPYALHHNPKYFPDPERFDPERFSPEREKALPRFAYIPFGAGPRVCIGNSFAMMEAKLLLATMAKRYHFELDPTQKIAPLPQITLSNDGGMLMQVRKR